MGKDSSVVAIAVAIAVGVCVVLFFGYDYWKSPTSSTGGSNPRPASYYLQYKR